MMNRFFWSAMVCLSLACVTAPLDGAVVRGTVTDSSGQVLPGVTVELSAPKQTTTVVQTNTEGQYAAQVKGGTYTAVFKLLNFATTRRSGIHASDQEERIENARLQISATASIVVTGKKTFRNLADLDTPLNDMIGVADAASVGVVTSKQLETRPMRRAGDVLETIPGVVISQHSGEGKANQYYLRGFNLDHGTDFSTTVAGAPVNMPTSGHGQGYSDNSFLLPELVSAIQYRKGPYYADAGDFSSAGTANINYVNFLEHPLLSITGGGFGYRRALAAGSVSVGSGIAVGAIEVSKTTGRGCDRTTTRK